jgi:hypothetical protein
VERATRQVEAEAEGETHAARDFSAQARRNSSMLEIRARGTLPCFASRTRAQQEASSASIHKIKVEYLDKGSCIVENGKEMAPGLVATLTSKMVHVGEDFRKEAPGERMYIVDERACGCSGR